LIALGDSLTIVDRQLIADRAVRHGLPTACAFRTNVEAGSLFSYGPNLMDRAQHPLFIAARGLVGLGEHQAVDRLLLLGLGGVSTDRGPGASATPTRFHDGGAWLHSGLIRHARRAIGDKGFFMSVLLRLSRAIDWLNAQFGVIANWLVLLACLISAGNAGSRYLFSESSNGWLEIQWYMFGGMVLLGAPYTLKVNEHVRVDLLYGMVSERTRIWIDIVGGFLFLLPICTILAYFTWPWFVESWCINEASSNAGGLVRWPVKLMLRVGFALMALQGISEIIKRIAALEHLVDIEFKYEKPLQ